MRLNLLLTTVLTFILMLPTAMVFSQDEMTHGANYRLAERFSPTQIQRMVFSTRVTPNWMKMGDKFWYSYKTSQGTSWYQVDLDRQSKSLLFDNHEMARQLTLITKDPYDHQNLPEIKPKFIQNDKAFRFKVTSTLMVDEKEKKEEEKKDELRVVDARDTLTTKSRPAPKQKAKVFHLEYDMTTGLLKEIEEEETPEPKGWASVSPDSIRVVFSRDYNLYWMDKENYLKALKDEKDSTIVEHQLTTDGEQYYPYGGGYTPDMNADAKKIKEESQKRFRAPIVWSHDSQQFALVRNDMRDIKFMWVINSLSNSRPTLESYKYQIPGEENPAESELWVFDMRTLKGDTIPVAAFKNQTVSVATYVRSNKESIEDHNPPMWLSASSDELYFTRLSRDLKRYDVCRVNLNTKEVKVLIEERMNTYIDNRNPHLVVNTGEIIQWSERDGWAHFYLYDRNGQQKHQITTGPWHADQIVKVDEKNRVLYFTAQGREAGENPYYTHLYSVNLDGTGLRLLNAGDYNHLPYMSDSFRYFINNYSRVDANMASEVRNARGELVMRLETADLSNLNNSGYRFPEPFTVKAADGVNDLYGVMYKPFDFDPNKSYPLILYVYPGPQTEAVNTDFSASMDRTDRLAQLGFIVVTIGNRGGHPNRSKWYHNYGYGDLRDYGLADKKYGAEQLADRHPYIDINRVGIFGHSGGGFMSTAAMLQYPDFFKVAVSSAGNHENNLYNRWWSEKHHGVKEIVNNEGEVKFVYEIETNSSLAKNLKGKLLLTTGDIDNNVHPGNTYRMADALIKAKKRFDMFVFTGQRHAYGDFTEYNFWLTGDYFVRHLLGEQTISTDIFEMRREHKLEPSKSRKQ